MSNLQVNHHETLKNLLIKAKSKIAEVATSQLNPERLIKLAMVASTKNPKLAECDHISIIRCLMDSASLGLEPFTALQQSYIIPYWNGKRRVMEAQFQIGYRGLIELARRSETIATIEAHCIHENDHFEYELGLEPKLVHRPKMDVESLKKGRGEVIATYAIARFKDGSYQYDFMTRGEVDEIRKRSKSAESGPWVDFYSEMARKTVVKRLCKYLPMTTELSRAIAKDNESEGAVETSFVEVEAFETDLSDIKVEPAPSVHKIEADNSLNKAKDDLRAICDLHLEGKPRDQVFARIDAAKDFVSLEKVQSVVASYVRQKQAKEEKKTEPAKAE